MGSGISTFKVFYEKNRVLVRENLDHPLFLTYKDPFLEIGHKERIKTNLSLFKSAPPPPETFDVYVPVTSSEKLRAPVVANPGNRALISV